MNRFLGLCVSGLLMLCGQATPAAPGEASPGLAAAAQASARYGSVPLSFEANEGQADSRFRFLARGQGYAVFLAPAEAILSLQSPKPDRHPSIIRMRLSGAKKTPEIAALGPQSGTSNYFIGNDPRKWRRDIAHYARVKYAGVYPGIDLVYYGNQRQLEYDFVVAPGADPSRIGIEFEGAERVRIDENGDLILHTAAGDAVYHKPVVYQDVDGRQQTVTGSYVRAGKNRVGFRVAAYDRSKPLVIDPVLSYSTYLGGSKDDEGRAIAVDASGNAYILGDTSSTNFPVANAIQPGIRTFSGIVLGPDVFVTKLNAAGTAIVYSTYLGGDGFEGGRGIAVDASGNAYITGVTYSTNFPLVAASQSVPGDNGFFGDAFVAKLNAAGSALVYSTYLGGNGVDEALGLPEGAGRQRGQCLCDQVQPDRGACLLDPPRRQWRRLGARHRGRPAIWYGLRDGEHQFHELPDHGRCSLECRMHQLLFRDEVERGGFGSHLFGDDQRHRQRHRPRQPGKQLRDRLHWRGVAGHARCLPAKWRRIPRRVRREAQCDGNGDRLRHLPWRRRQRPGQGHRGGFRRPCLCGGRHQLNHIPDDGGRAPDRLRGRHRQLLDGRVRDQAEHFGNGAGVFDLPRRQRG